MSFLLDGYTKTADCRGLNITFREVPLDDWYAYQDALDGAPQDARRRLTAELIAKQIERWDAVLDGQPAAITADNVLKLPVAVWLRIQDLLLGYTTEGVNTQGDDLKNSEAA